MSAIGRGVQKLLMKRAFPVDGSTTEINSAEPSWGTHRHATGVDAPSSGASLVLIFTSRRISLASELLAVHFKKVPDVVHRFEESIAGRVYLIEVAAVAQDRWRAHIARLPGVPTAMMPFYGRTPDEAARQLSDWLTKAHERAAALSGSA
jgi:hypothetical protein